MMGRGKEAEMRKADGGKEGLHEIHIDYCFPKTSGGEGLTVLVARERSTRMTMATVVPRKGAVGDFAAARIMAFIRELGLAEADIIMKGDQEAAIKAVIEKVAGMRPTARTIPEHSPVGSSGSNGVVERAVQEVEGQLRTMRLAAEGRFRARFGEEHAAVTWR